MATDIDIEKLKNEYPEFFKQIPIELIELVVSEETASNIADICLKNGIKDEEKIEKIAYRIVLVLLRQLPKENLPKILENGAELNSETAIKISNEVNEIIFSQIGNKETPLTKSSPLLPLEKEKTKKLPKKDTYREPIE